jgi:hypothetical protein
MATEKNRAVVGAAAGGIAGGAAGKAVGEAINPTAEEGRPYSNQSAYRYGWESYNRHVGRDCDAVEPELRSGWEEAGGESPLTSDQARPAARDAWDRLAARAQANLRMP